MVLLYYTGRKVSLSCTQIHENPFKGSRNLSSINCEFIELSENSLSSINCNFIGLGENSLSSINCDFIGLRENSFFQSYNQSMIQPAKQPNLLTSASLDSGIITSSSSTPTSSACPPSELILSSIR